jgi:hypothetical protein
MAVCRIVLHYQQYEIISVKNVTKNSYTGKILQTAAHACTTSKIQNVGTQSLNNTVLKVSLHI